MEVTGNDWLFARSAEFCFVVMIAYMIHWVIRHRSIDHRMAWYLTGAVLCVSAGTQFLHIWLGMNYIPSDFILETPWLYDDFEETIFGFHPHRQILYVFGALTVHYLIYAGGHLFSLCRTRRHRTANLVHATLGLLAILGKCVVVYALWYSSYATTFDEVAREEAENGWGVPGGDTEVYLQEWLAKEPGSLHAQYLLDRYNGIDNPENYNAFIEVGNIRREKRKEEKRRKAQGQTEEQERRKRERNKPSIRDSLDDLLNELGGDETPAE